MQETVPLQKLLFDQYWTWHLEIKWMLTDYSGNSSSKCMTFKATPRNEKEVAELETVYRPFKNKE